MYPKPISFCIGTPKSGTTSIAGVFSCCESKNVSHEPERKEMVSILNLHQQHLVSDDYIVQWYLTRRERLQLDLESNCFLTYRFDLVLRAFPAARIILPVRFPHSWLRSVCNNNIRFSAGESETVAKYHDLLFNPKAFNYDPEEELTLVKWRLYPVDAYLHYWRTVHESIIGSVPRDRLFVLKTEDIGGNVDKLYKFVGWDREGEILDCHLNKAPHDAHPLDGLEDFINSKILSICGDTMQKLTSLINNYSSADDVMKYEGLNSEYAFGHSDKS